MKSDKVNKVNWQDPFGYRGPRKLSTMAATRIAIELWFTVIGDMNYELENEKADIHWWGMEESVAAKIKQLPVPEDLQNEVTCVYAQVGASFLSLIEDYRDVLDVSVYFHPSHVAELPWTTLGEINWEQTIEMILADANLDDKSRFLFACSRCCEKLIPLLWSQLSSESRQYMANWVNPCLRRDGFHQQLFLQTYWTLLMFKEFVLLDVLLMPTDDGEELSDYDFNDYGTSTDYDSEGEDVIPLQLQNENVIPLQLQNENVIPLQLQNENLLPLQILSIRWSLLNNMCANSFFWSKLTDAEKMETMVWAVDQFGKRDRGLWRCYGPRKLPTFPADSAFFLLTLMDIEQRKEVFNTCAEDVLTCLASEYKFREHFAITMRHLCDRLDGPAFIRVLILYCQRVVHASHHMDQANQRFAADGICARDLKNIWCHSPMELKRHVLVDGWDLLWRLILMGDAKSLQLVVSVGSNQEWWEVIASRQGLTFFRNLLRVGYKHFYLFAKQFYSCDVEIAEFEESLMY